MKRNYSVVEGHVLTWKHLWHYAYEVCLKSNGTGVTNDLFQFQQATFFPF